MNVLVCENDQLDLSVVDWVLWCFESKLSADLLLLFLFFNILPLRMYWKKNFAWDWHKGIMIFVM